MVRLVNNRQYVCPRCLAARLYRPISQRTIQGRVFDSGGAEQIAGIASIHDGKAAHARNPYLDRRPSQVLHTSKIQNGSAAIEVFKSVVEEQKQGDLAAPKLLVSAGSMKLLEMFESLDAMMKRQEPMWKCFNFWEKEVYPRILGSGEGVSKVFLSKAAHFMRAVSSASSAKARDIRSNDNMPSAARISTVMLELGIFEPHAWSQLVLHLLQDTSRIQTSPEAYTASRDYEKMMAMRGNLLAQVWEAWKVLSLDRFTVVTVGSATKALHTSRMAMVDTGRPVTGSKKKDINYAFTAMFPQYEAMALSTVPAAAIATYVLFTGSDGLRGASLEEASPFLDSVFHILSEIIPKARHLETLFMHFDELHAYITAQWPAIHERLLKGLSGSLYCVDGAKEEPGRERAQFPSPERLHRDLEQALRNRNVGLAKRTWVAFWGNDAGRLPDKDRIAWLEDNTSLFNRFITVYMAMHHPTLAIEVWNMMLSIGIEAKLKSWTSMLEGCRRAKNAHYVTKVWDKLVASGEKLDTAVWTTRISGLMDGGEPDSALQVLNEMVRAWNEKHKPGYKAIAVMPTIEPVNAALTGLVRLQRLPAARGVLAWAAAQNIQPDVYTFNILLRPVVRGGMSEEVEKLLDMMREQDVEPNVVTFTIILEGALAQVAKQDPEKTKAIVNRIIDDMEASGVKVNILTYAKMIYVLLQEEAEESAIIVMNHIRSKKLELSAHIYTMWAEHHFSKGKVDAVKDLIKEHQLHRKRFIDRIFWERVIKGYCHAGEITSAWDIFRNVDRGGAVITYSTLYELLGTLIMDDNMRTAAELMRAVLKKKQMMEKEFEYQDQNGRVWKHRFWHLAERHSLLTSEMKKSLGKLDF